MATEITQDVRPAGSAAYGGLAEVVSQESRALEEFAGVLERQRAAVSAGDRPALDHSVEDLDRLLLRLAKQREQRQSMIDSLSGERGWSLTQFVDRLGESVPLALSQAQRQLRHAAESAARASRVNNVVLRRVLDSERTFLQSLFTDGPVVGYPGASTVPSSGWLLDREG